MIWEMLQMQVSDTIARAARAADPSGDARLDRRLSERRVSAAARRASERVSGESPAPELRHLSLDERPGSKESERRMPVVPP